MGRDAYPTYGPHVKAIANTFLKGLIFTVPLVITFGLIYWLFAAAESLLRIPIRYILPEGWYVPGMGVASAILIIFTHGVLVQLYLVKHLMRFVEEGIELVLSHIPIVKTLYGSARDLMSFITGGKGDEMKKAVAITFDNDIRLIGFVTNENASLNGESDLVAVYLPMSYQVGGYLVYVPKSRCTPLDIPVQEAMQQVLTADIKGKRTKNLKPIEKVEK